MPFLSTRNRNYHCEHLQCLLLCKSMDWFLYDRDLRHERDIAHQNLPASEFFACNFHEAKLRKA